MNLLLIKIEILVVRLMKHFGIKLDSSIIPNGPYCYTLNGKNGKTKKGIPFVGINTCTYYRHLKGLNAGCIYVGFVGWDCLLGDQCKICGFHDDIDQNDLS